MKNYDIILQELDKILSNTSGFYSDGWFQENGITTLTDIAQDHNIPSPFSFNFEGQSVLHFTSLDSAIKILDSKYIRASSLNSLSDKRELFHAFNLINMDHEGFHEAKKKSFIACFTPLPKNGKISDLDYHWDNYGNKRRGLAFEFEVLRKPAYYYTLNVNYLDSNEQSKFLSYLHSSPASKVNLNALVPIFTSIKSPLFQEEAEVRLMAMCDEYQLYVENMKLSRIGVTFTPENKASYYLQLPLIFNNEELDQKAEPLLRLKKIYFGKELEINDGQEFLLRYIIPLCDKYEITYEWMPRL